MGGDGDPFPAFCELLMGQTRVVFPLLGDPFGLVLEAADLLAGQVLGWF